MNLARFNLDSKEWGRVLILRPIPRGDDPWGALAPLKGTPWGDLLPIVSGEVFSYACYGHITPLMNEIGRPPRGLSRKVPADYRLCTLRHEGCLMASDKCQPGPDLPHCYRPPNLAVEAQRAATVVALAWQEGRYVVVVDGPEISL